VLRNLAAITTPFRTDGDVDLDAFEAHVRWLGEAGVDGLFVAGTTGEGILLEPDEVEALTRRAVASAGSMEIIAQVGRASTRATIALAHRAVGAGAHGVAAYVPWFYPLAQEQVRAHFLAVLEAVDGTPAWLYNIPPRTVNDLEPETAAELARAGYRGMKDSTGELDRHLGYLEAVRGIDGFAVLTGTEPLIPESVAAGAEGSINGLSNCVPEVLVAMRDKLAAGDDASAEQQELAALKAEVKGGTSMVGAIKQRVRDRLAERGVDYPAATRGPFA
jgi:4-hydroxy-tetrahydrodipicolinate synthase